MPIRNAPFFVHIASVDDVTFVHVACAQANNKQGEPHDGG